MSMTRMPDNALSMLILPIKGPNSVGLLEKIADAFELVERACWRDQQHLVEADSLEALQPLARIVRQTDERDLGALGQAAGFGLGAEVDHDIGEDGIGAPGFAIEAHAVFEILPAAVEARGDPALALLCGIIDPPRVAPSAEQYRRPALASGPRRQRAAVDRLAAPGPPHDFQRAHQGTKALIIISAEEIEIGLRRSAADAETQAAARHCLNRLHAMGELDRIAQRDLQHRGAELDPLGRGGQHPESDEWVEGRPAAAERIGDPDPGKPPPFDAAGVVDDATERPIARLRARTQKRHHTQSHSSSLDTCGWTTMHRSSAPANCRVVLAGGCRRLGF